MIMAMSAWEFWPLAILMGLVFVSLFIGWWRRRAQWERDKAEHRRWGGTAPK